MDKADILQPVDQWTMDNGQWIRLISFSLWTNGQLIIKKQQAIQYYITSWQTFYGTTLSKDFLPTVFCALVLYHTQIA
ncbi:MAG: hypothetical protein FWF88_11060 [Peptococcaceae bacterium]|nr:hypothetical protein [Peptococcaceae bacterium]